MTMVRTCPGCADKVSAGDAFCESCGRPLTEEARQAPAERPDTVPTTPQESLASEGARPDLIAPDGGPTAPQVSLYGTDRYGGSSRDATSSGATAREESDPQGVYRTVNPADVTVAGVIPSDATPRTGTPSGEGRTGAPSGSTAPAGSRTGTPSGATAPSGAPVPGAPPADAPRAGGRSLTESLAVDDDWNVIDSLVTQPVRRDPPPPAPAPGPAREKVVPDWPPPSGAGPVQPTNPDLCVWCPGRVLDGYCEKCGFLQPTGRDHVEVRARTVVGVSDRGLRHRRNEDAMAIRVVPDDSPHAPGVVCAVVCDGVSSSPRSDEASRITAETGATVLVEQVRRGVDAREATGVAMTRAAEAVAAIAESPSSAPACTFVSAVVDPVAGTVTVGWVGDSRAYWLSGGPSSSASALLTRDDSWSEAMVQMGALSREEAMRSANAHALIAWMGADSGEIDAHISTVTPTGPGTVLLCSDGLWNYYPEARALTEVVPGAGTRPLEAARTYVRLALEGGGKDNITVVVVPVTAGGPRAGQG
ncbi:protein phosphatase 2C domain-containing protein [Nocardiopsis sp. N85]|uniref:protein phosphatase 2C domain-containing protein n=1 Tax=Nocardiopsis sp. N85 TaxID=3029400 RepID=UPI00237F65C8|nr:protein phosphatase 2C domain-containing protein [Nocardiopsis sp. N85]MDE3722544.1 protein phosphatase 2C domain-containing protein [Nocardiopsis sp. N85]